MTGMTKRETRARTKLIQELHLKKGEQRFLDETIDWRGGYTLLYEDFVGRTSLALTIAMRRATTPAMVFTEAIIKAFNAAPD